MGNRVLQKCESGGGNKRPNCQAGGRGGGGTELPNDGHLVDPDIIPDTSVAELRERNCKLEVWEPLEERRYSTTAIKMSVGGGGGGARSKKRARLGGGGGGRTENDLKLSAGEPFCNTLVRAPAEGESWAGGTVEVEGVGVGEDVGVAVA